MTKRLAGKVALVTRRIARDGRRDRPRARGRWHVAISYVASADKALTVVRDFEANGVRAAAFQADQAHPAEVEDLVESAAERFGPLASWSTAPASRSAACSAIPPPTSPRSQSTSAGWRPGVRAAAPLMRDGGRIISIGSTVGERVVLPGLSDYAATKAAAAAYSQGWARDLGPRGITVNVVQPGPVDTT
jgi:3-oxoacyl-[acyl-carrier protein] reductase